MNMAKMMLKIIVNKVIIKVHKYNSNDGIEYESEDDGIEKEGYKYNEDKCNNKDNDDDDSDNDDD